MKHGVLSDYFVFISYKRLSAVEIVGRTSNQHEFQGTASFRTYFGTADRKIPGRFLYLTDRSEGPTATADGMLTWYNARARQKNRSAEFRIFYDGPLAEVIGDAKPGDLLILAAQRSGPLMAIIAESGSTIESQLVWLFGISGAVQNTLFETRNFSTDDRTLDLVASLILESAGVELIAKSDDHLDEMLKKFPAGLPDTATFSKYARSKSRKVSPRDDADGALMQWMEQEEALFRTFERHLISSRLKEGFSDDVDSFISFSLSVQNRRKSRVGRALENHLEKVFIENGIRYGRGQVTEGKSKPDFLFPGVDKYGTPRWPAEKLTMLGVKSTCKDRWRQILTEAKRIPLKHLFTLEAPISINQTDEMVSQSVQLVIPKSLHSAFAESQRKKLLELRQFIGLVASRQS